MVKTAAELLVKTDLYKLHNITVRPNWTHDFQKDFEEIVKNQEHRKNDGKYLEESWEEPLTEEEKAIETQETLSSYIPKQFWYKNSAWRRTGSIIIDKRFRFRCIGVSYYVRRTRKKI